MEMKKLILTESEKNRIKELYGVVSEQKYMKNYSGSLLDFCGYRAIEKFEETMGTPDGTSMGDNYFESKVAEYESNISKNIQNTIGLSVFNRMPPKLKMQIWSFMFNGTDASTGTVKWLAGLSQAMNMDKFLDDKTAQDFRIKTSKKGSSEYNDAVEQIVNFQGSWGDVYKNYLIVLDKQYRSTAENNDKQSSYNNSWKFRPANLSKYYDECGFTKNPNISDVVNKNTDETNKLPSHHRGSVNLGKNAFNELSRELQKWSSDESQDGNSFSVGSFYLKYNSNDNKISFDIFGKPTDPKYKKLILAINDEAKASQESKGYKLISSGKIQLPGEFASSRPGGYSWYIFGEPSK